MCQHDKGSVLNSTMGSNEKSSQYVQDRNTTDALVFKNNISA